MRDFDKHVRVSMPKSSSGIVELEVEDTTSGVILVVVRLTAEQAFDLITGTYTTVDTGWVASPGQLAKVGKRHENTIVKLGLPPSEVGYDRNGQRAWATKMAAENPLAAEYDTTEVRHTNAGWDAIYRRWVED